jgi:hypothetical protein
MMSAGTNFNSWGIKGVNRFKENKAFNELSSRVMFATTMAFLSSLSDNKSIITQKNADYLSSLLDLAIPGLGTLLVTPNNPEDRDHVDLGWVTARGCSFLDKAVEVSNLRYKLENNQIERVVLMTSHLAEKAMWAKQVAIESDDFNFSDIFQPLRNSSLDIENNTHTETEEEKPTSSKDPMSESDAYSHRFPLSSGQTDDYDSWVQYCLEAGDLQRIPRELIVDLIPSRSAADHSRKDLEPWRKILEETHNGHRQWLIMEGVTENDFQLFWSSPTWVQIFIDKLMLLNLRLEFQAHMSLGLDEQKAQEVTLGFIPHFHFEPPTVFDMSFSPLPLELFERVRLHMAKIDSPAYQDDLIKHDSFSANHYIRRKIRDGVI